MTLRVATRTPTGARAATSGGSRQAAVDQAACVPVRHVPAKRTGSGDAADARVNAVVIFILASFRVAEPVPTCDASIHARVAGVKECLRTVLRNARERKPPDLVGLCRRERGQRCA